MIIKKEKSIIEIDSWLPWKTTVIMSWVHGNELSWIKVMNSLIPNIKIIKWKVIFIFANLRAIELWKREYKKNMNRCFLKENNWMLYEDIRAREIIRYLDKADFLLDLHNTLNKENSIPFIISEYDNLSELFDVSFSIKWFDKLHPWWSDWYMNNIWKVWLCLESGSIYDDNSCKIVKKSIINFLKYTKNISWKPKFYNDKKYIKFNKIYKNKTNNFIFTKKFRDFEQISKWDILAFDWNETIETNSDYYMLFPYVPKNIWDECFCLWKEYK